MVSRVVHRSERSPELFHVPFGSGDEVRKTWELVFNDTGLLLLLLLSSREFGLCEVETGLVGGVVVVVTGRDDGEETVDFLEGGDEANVERGCKEEKEGERCDDERENPSLLHVYYVPHCSKLVDDHETKRNKLLEEMLESLGTRHNLEFRGLKAYQI